MLFTKKIEVTKLEACALSVVQWFGEEVMPLGNNSAPLKAEKIYFSQINLRVDEDPNRSDHEIPAVRNGYKHDYKFKRVRIKAQFLLEERITNKKSPKDKKDQISGEIVFMKELSSDDWHLYTVYIEYNFVDHSRKDCTANFLRTYDSNYIDRIGKRADLLNLVEYLLS
jgi:hypothetical protein